MDNDVDHDALVQQDLANFKITNFNKVDDDEDDNDSLAVQNCCKITAKVENFSDQSNAQNQFEAMCLQATCKLAKVFRVKVHPNGNESSNEGSVSIALESDSKRICWAVVDQHKYGGLKSAEVTCVVSVIDQEGSRRFIQSFGRFSPDFNYLSDDLNIVIGDYISRRSLLNSPAEFLPEDTLTLEIDIRLKLDCVERDYSMDIVEMSGNFRDAEGNRLGILDYPQIPDPVYLSLASPLATFLASHSEYFARVLEAPMREKHTGLVRVSKREYRDIFFIARLLGPSTPVVAYDVSEIYDLYVTADKYGFKSVTEISRNWLISCLSHENVSEISTSADRYDDLLLSNGVQEVMARQLQTSEEGSDSDDSVGGDTRYMLECDAESSEITFKCVRGRKSTEIGKMTSDNRSFDFYI